MYSLEMKVAYSQNFPNMSEYQHTRDKKNVHLFVTSYYNNQM